MPLPDIGESIRRNQEQYKGPLIMGVINVTPDSFSGLPSDADPGAAYDRARRLLDEGADVLDIGAESTRPGFLPVSYEAEKRRLLPVLDRMGTLAVPLSIDTRSPEIIRECLPYGVQIINDVGGLRNPGFTALLSQNPLLLAVLMHSPEDPMLHAAYEARGIAMTVQNDLKHRLATLEQKGISRNRLIVDPGLGFGKNTSGNIALLHALEEWSPGGPLLLGASRKRFIGEISGERDPLEREAGTIAVQIWAHLKKVSMIRTHDVRKARQARSVFQSIMTGEIP